VTSPAPVARRTQRYDIAVLRVLAIVGVVLIHVTGLTTTNDALHRNHVWWAAEVLFLSSKFCVPLFALVSGALLLRPGSSEPAGDFYRKRMARLIPPLIVWYVVYSAFTIVVLDRDRTFPMLIALWLSGRTYTALYFFWLILGLYVATPWLRVLLGGLDRDALLKVGLGLTALTCAWQTTVLFVDRYSSVDVDSTPTALTYWVPYVGYFVLGGALAQRRFARRAAPVAGLVALVSTAVTVWVASGSSPRILSLVASSSYQSWTVAVTTAALFVLVASLLEGEREAGVGLRFVVVLGNATLGVFATHLLVLYGIRHLGLLTVVDGASRLLELGYLITATLAVSFAIAVVGGKLPGMRRVL
jgi:surface polysaccharide O-acyltransferase-like enzyme